MEHIKWTSDNPNLSSTVLVVAFEGWNDAGESATTAAKHLIEHLDGTKFAEIDPEMFFDFTETRPHVRIDEEGRNISWPSNEFWAIETPEEQSDLIVLVGNEPQLKWLTYIEQIVSIIEEYEVDLVISLGALIAEVVHSRPATIYSTSDDPDLIDKLKLEPSNYEGPTGIVGVLQDALKSTDSNTLALWATIPGYVPQVPSPKAALALVNKIVQTTKIDVPTAILELNSDTYESQITELVAEDEETQGYVTELEQNYDSARPESGAELISELEQFLRDRDDQ